MGRRRGTELADAWQSARALRFLTGLAFAGTALTEWAFLNGRPDVAAQTLAQWSEHADRPGAGPVTAEVLRYCARAGVPVGDHEVPADCPAPLAAGLRGDWRTAAAGWTDLGEQSESALELAESGAIDGTLEALRILDRLGATAAALMVRRRLKDLGVRAIPRGPMARIRANPAGLTLRELDVLAPIAGDLTNAQIAARLFLSPRTVDHHVSSILTKLGVDSRGTAKSATESMGLVQVDR